MKELSLWLKIFMYRYVISLFIICTILKCFNLYSVFKIVCILVSCSAVFLSSVVTAGWGRLNRDNAAPIGSELLL